MPTFEEYPGNNRLLPTNGTTGYVPVQQSNGTTAWTAPSGIITAGGAVTLTDTQTISGSKTFSGSFNFGSTSYSNSTTVTLASSSTTFHITTHTSGDKQFTLPLASAAPGKIFVILKTTTAAQGGFIHLTCSGSDTFHGTTTTYYIDHQMPVTIISDGVSRWVPLVRVMGVNANLPDDTVSPYQEFFPHEIVTGTTDSLSGSSKTIRVYTSGSSITVTLPTTSSINPSTKVLYLKRAGTGTVTVNRASSNTIRYKSTDTNTSFTLPSDGSYAVLVSDFTNTRWYVIDGSPDVLLQFGYTQAGLPVTSHTGAGTAIYGLNKVTATVSGYTLIIPTAVGHSGEHLIVKRTDDNPSNVITLDPAGSETIDGNSTVTITTQWSSYTLISDGSNWLIE